MSKRKAMSSSSKGKEVMKQGDLLTPIPNHPWLHFTSKRHKDRYSSLLHKRIEPTRVLNMDDLGCIDLEESVTKLLNSSGLLLLNQVLENGYVEIFLEFLSTFSLKKDLLAIGHEKCISFRLGNKNFDLSSDEFGSLCGAYPMSVFNFDTLIDVRKEHYVFPEHTFWNELCNSNGLRHDSTRSKITAVHAPEVFIIHRWITKSLNARKESDSVVNKQDLCLLHAIMKRKKIHVGILLASYFDKLSKKTDGGAFYGATYITRLAKGLGVLTEGFTISLTEVAKTDPFKMENWENMKIVTTEDDFYVLNWKKLTPPGSGSTFVQDAGLSSQGVQATSDMQGGSSSMPLPIPEPQEEPSEKKPEVQQWDGARAMLLLEKVSKDTFDFRAYTRSRLRRQRAEIDHIHTLARNTARSLKWVHETLSALCVNQGVTPPPEPAYETIEQLPPNPFPEDFTVEEDMVE